MWDELPASGSWKEDIVEEREREKERREWHCRRAEGKEKAEERTGRGAEEEVWENAGSVANPTLSHKGNRLASCLPAV